MSYIIASLGILFVGGAYIYIRANKALKDGKCALAEANRIFSKIPNLEQEPKYFYWYDDTKNNHVAVFARYVSEKGDIIDMRLKTFRYDKNDPDDEWLAQSDALELMDELKAKWISGSM